MSDEELLRRSFDRQASSQLASSHPAKLKQAANPRATRDRSASSQDE